MQIVISYNVLLFWGIRLLYIHKVQNIGFVVFRLTLFYFVYYGIDISNILYEQSNLVDYFDYVWYQLIILFRIWINIGKMR